MNLRLPSLVSFASLVALAGCLPPPLEPCDSAGCEESSTGASSSTGEGTPTTSEGTPTGTGEEPQGSSGSDEGEPDDSEETGSSETGEPGLPPAIITGVVVPDYTAKNAVLDVKVTVEHADGVRMQIDGGPAFELTPVRPGEFGWKIAAYTGLDNGEHEALLTPWRETLSGDAVSVEYVIALPAPGYEIGWADGGSLMGSVAAIGVLPDGRPFEFGTFKEAGQPRCYLRPRALDGTPGEVVPVLPGVHCTAIDASSDRVSGEIHVLVERMSGQDVLWWAATIAAWGKGAKEVGAGKVGDKALALASRPGLVAVCGERKVETMDKRDGLAVLLRPGKAAAERVFDYRLPGDPDEHGFGESIRDCTFADEMLVLVGEAHGRHVGGGNVDKLRERLVVIEHEPVADETSWIVAGPGPGVQSRGLAIDVDDQGRYQIAGYTCLDACEPEGEIRVYAPGGKLESQVSMGPLGSAWFGPHDIAWSPAGYAVVALGELQGQTWTFKVQAFAPKVFEPLWTFTPLDKIESSLALAVAVGPFGEVYAGGIAADRPAFAVIGG